MTMATNHVNQIVKAITPTLTSVFTNAFESLKTAYDKQAEDYKKALSVVEDNYIKVGNELADTKAKLAESNQQNEEIKHMNEQLNDRVKELSAELETAKQTAPTAPKGKRLVLPHTNTIRHRQFDKVKSCVEHNKPIYLCGPAGTGKTQLCKEVADELGLDFYMTAKVADEFGVVGYMDGHGKYNDTPFYKAMKFGGLFMFDELDASDSNAVVAVNTAIANRYFTFPNGEMVKAHGNFRMVACGNTFGTGADDQYTGRAPLDASTIDRFGYIFVDYDERVELACAKGSKEIVTFIHDLRQAIKKARITTFTISYRAIINLVDYEQMFGTDEAVQMAITKGLDNDNVKNISRNMTCTNKYATAFSKSAVAYANVA